MSESIVEYVSSASAQVKIDPQRGILHGVKILGNESRNGRYYPDETLRESIVLYENAKVNLNHPENDPKSPRQYQDRLGYINSVHLKEGRGLYADFHFNPKHALAEQLLWDAQNSPENVGFSHNVEAILKRENDRIFVEKIVSVRSVDLVADPATTSGLFECHVDTDSCSTLKNEETEMPQGKSEDSEIQEQGVANGQANETCCECKNCSYHLAAKEVTSNEVERNVSSCHEIVLEYVYRELKNARNSLSAVLEPIFLESICEQKDESLVRRLVEERLALLNRMTNHEPKSVGREIFETGREVVCDAKTFVEAIREQGFR